MICPNCNLPRYYGPTGLAAPQCSCVHSYQPPKRTLPNEVDNAALLAAIDAAAPAPTAKESLTRSQRMAAAGFAARDRRLPCDECGKLFSVQMLPVHKCEPVLTPTGVNQADVFAHQVPITPLQGQHYATTDGIRCDNCGETLSAHTEGGRACPAPAQAQQAEGYVSQSALDWLADPMRGQRSCITTTIYRQPEGGSNTPIYIHAATKVEAEQNPDTADAERYRWLVSRPLDGDDEFYINAEDSKTANADGFWALGGDMSKTQADDYIDAARGIGASSGESGNGM